MLGEVFSAYIKNPKLLGDATAKRVQQDGVERTVCDYVSGMTDRYLLEEYTRIFSGKKRTSFSAMGSARRQTGPKRVAARNASPRGR